MENRSMFFTILFMKLYKTKTKTKQKTNKKTLKKKDLTGRQNVSKYNIVTIFSLANLQKVNIIHRCREIQV